MGAVSITIDIRETKILVLFLTSAWLISFVWPSFILPFDPPLRPTLRNG